MIEEFKLAPNGDIIGPGGMVFAKEMQILPGKIVLDVELMNKLYQLGVLAGKVQEGDGTRLINDHIAAAKNELELEADKDKCWRCFGERHRSSARCELDSIEYPDPPWVKR